MLEVTERAKEKLKEALLEEKMLDPDVTYRITPIPSMPNRLGIALDKEKGGDQAVKSDEGITILLVELNLAPMLKGMVLDYQEKPQGNGFKILKLSSLAPRQGEA